MNDVELLNETLKRIDVGMREGIGGLKDRLDTVEARLEVAEQTAAEGRTRIGAPHGVPATMGSAAAEAARDNPEFEHLRAWNHGSVRLNLDGGIRNALTSGNANSPSSGITVAPVWRDYTSVFGPIVSVASIIDLLNWRTTTRDVIEYVDVGITGDVGVQIKQGTEKAEVDFEGEAKTVKVAQFAAHTTASRQILDDMQEIAAVIDSTLRAKLRFKMAKEFIQGALGPTTPVSVFNGLLASAATFIPTAATSVPDKVGECIANMTAMGYQPDVIGLHPSAFFKHCQIAKSTTEGLYLMGSPAQPAPPMLWGRPVCLEPAMPTTAVMVLDSRFVALIERQAPTILISNSHNDNFTKNLVTILAECRATLQVGTGFAVQKFSIS